jgi:hypothetical protein
VRDVPSRATTPAGRDGLPARVPAREGVHAVLGRAGSRSGDKIEGLASYIQRLPIVMVHGEAGNSAVESLSVFQQPSIRGVQPSS